MGSVFKMFGLFFLSTLSTLPIQVAHAADPFNGIGQIIAINSSDWTVADPKRDYLGCMDDSGKLSLNDDCGTFSRRATYPYTLSTKNGNCTFSDTTTPRNTDSVYGRNDFAWSCSHTISGMYDDLYTVDGFPYTYLCFGDFACYYDAKTVPSKETPKNWLWQFHWGSQQMGITPGHTMIQLIWQKTGDLPKREDAEPAPATGARVVVNEKQTPLLKGKKILW